MEVLKCSDESKKIASINETMKVKCECCGAVLGICPRDLNSKGGIIRKLKYYFTCEECDGTTYILPETLEPSFRKRVDKEIANKDFWS